MRMQLMFCHSQVDSAFLGERPDVIVFDCNPRSEVIAHIIRRAREVGVDSE